jgi:hypothetical protein
VCGLVRCRLTNGLCQHPLTPPSKVSRIVLPSAYRARRRGGDHLRTSAFSGPLGGRSDSPVGAALGSVCRLLGWPCPRRLRWTSPRGRAIDAMLEGGRGRAETLSCLPNCARLLVVRAGRCGADATGDLLPQACCPQSVEQLFVFILRHLGSSFSVVPFKIIPVIGRCNQNRWARNTPLAGLTTLSSPERTRTDTSCMSDMGRDPER